jgi:hypothetical protein
MYCHMNKFSYINLQVSQLKDKILLPSKLNPNPIFSTKVLYFDEVRRTCCHDTISFERARRELQNARYKLIKR